jgi:hypothetical protein
VYNVRAGDRRGAVQLGGRELAAELVLLYMSRHGTWQTLGLFRRRGAWRVLSRTDLEALAYPRPGGDYYFCAELEPVKVPDWLQEVPDQIFAGTRPRPYGSPLAVTWQDIVESVD